MAYQSSYGSNYPYARESFGRRHYGDEAPARSGVSRVLFLSTLAAAILFALWSGATTFYLVFRDDVLHTLASRQMETTRSSDAQYAALSTELDRIRSTKFVDQEKIERQLSDLLRIQRLIEVRHDALAALAKSVVRNPRPHKLATFPGRKTARRLMQNRARFQIRFSSSRRSRALHRCTPVVLYPAPAFGPQRESISTTSPAWSAS